MNENFFCNSNFCQSISLSSVDSVLYLSCDQEETDARIPRRCHYIPNIQKRCTYCYKVTSDDTEIIHVGVSLLNRDHIFIDHGTEKKETLTGFHELAGSDYISSFFGNGKHKCRKR